MTIAAISTPLASGGIGIVRISGDDAIVIADKVFKPVSGKPLSGFSGYAASYGRFHESGKEFDSGVALVFRAPKSYTGENVVELSCHGGVFVTGKLLRAVLAAGAEPAGPGEFTKRAFLNGKMDLTEAESVMSLISANGELALSAALTTLDGILSRGIKAVADSLISVSASLSVWADFPEDDIADIDGAELLNRLNAAKNTLSLLLSKFDAGKAVSEGVETVICGSPNVGKSTLMNLLTGRESSIVTPAAGTTRDVIEETVRLGGAVLRLADTAGLRDGTGEIETIGIEKAKTRIDRAGLILAVFDSSEPLSGEDRALLEHMQGKRAVAVLNKTDLAAPAFEEEISPYVRGCIRISAKTGEGLDCLRDIISEILGTDRLDTSQPLITTERQRKYCLKAFECIEEAVSALESGMTWDAVNVSVDCSIENLLILTGEKAAEVVVDKVFEKFCIGK
ncbi:MAG: tRNA uridine-5-carboxymethylaminomethyl(34) synthesis GTPase MnmE [Oscillospiraceae bacterium]|nr:tRNA uridine-5-carboxymethylaminomethyl(34) synthesis GTPase MnmE [Oscillospiraceae bacterium]